MRTYTQAQVERQRVMDKRWREGRRNRLSEIKLTRGCADCGYNEHTVALDFDHVRGEKLFDISHGYRYTEEMVLMEIEKCDVVCANCHRVRTAHKIKGGK